MLLQKFAVTLVLSRNQCRLKLNAQISAQGMREVARKGLVQAIYRLHMLLADVAGEAAIPRDDVRLLDPRSRSFGARASANQGVNLFLA